MKNTYYVYNHIFIIHCLSLISYYCYLDICKKNLFILKVHFVALIISDNVNIYF